jgi:hypothetical protein
MENLASMALSISGVEHSFLALSILSGPTLRIYGVGGIAGLLTRAW